MESTNHLFGKENDLNQTSREFCSTVNLQEYIGRIFVKESNTARVELPPQTFEVPDLVTLHDWR